jgi:hypothetical protein
MTVTLQQKTFMTATTYVEEFHFYYVISARRELEQLSQARPMKI